MLFSKKNQQFDFIHLELHKVYTNRTYSEDQLNAYICPFKMETVIIAVDRENYIIMQSW